MSKQSREVRSGLAHPKNHVSKRLPPRSPESSGYRFSFRARIEHAPRRALIPSTRTRVPPPRVSPSNTRQVRASAASEHPGGALSANAARRARLVPTETTPRGALFFPVSSGRGRAAAEAHHLTRPGMRVGSQIRFASRTTTTVVCGAFEKTKRGCVHDEKNEKHGRTRRRPFRFERAS